MQNKNIQALLAEAQKKQRAYDRGVTEIEETEYEIEKNGIIKVVMLGSKEIVSITIDKDALTPDDKEFIEESLKKAINTIIEDIDNDIEDVRNATIGQTNNMGF